MERNKDLTISVKDDRRRIYGVEGAVDYLIPDTDWSTGVNFNVLKTESKVKQGRNPGCSTEVHAVPRQ